LLPEIRAAFKAPDEWRRMSKGGDAPFWMTLEKKNDKQARAAADAVTEERQRISRELHDRVLQLLSGARLRAESSRRQLSDHKSILADELHAIEESIDKAIIEIRNLLTENQESGELPAGSLERRLKQELEIFRARTGFKLDFQCAIGVKNLPATVERELYFTLREGILNAVRHSRATELHLALKTTAQGCTASLRDNGVGFESGAGEGSGHYGLRGMRERVRKIGGEIEFDSVPGKGTEIRITVPFNQR
jgi:signal transduction histidine kinase